MCYNVFGGFMELKQLTNQEFNDFTNNFNIKSIYQTKEYGFVMNNQNYDSLFLGLLKDGVIVASTLILIEKENGFKYAYAPRGYLIDYNDIFLFNIFTKYIKDYLNKLGIMGIKINPLIVRNIYDFKSRTRLYNPNYENIYNNLTKSYYHLGYNNYFEALKPRFEAVLDLDKPVNELFNNIKKSYRTKIRSAVNNGINIYKGNIDDIDTLYEFTKDKYIRNINYLKDCYTYFKKENLIDIYYTKLDTKKYLEVIQKKLNYYEQKSNYYNSLIFKNKNKENLIKKRMNSDKYLDQYKKELVYATKLLREHPKGIVTSSVLIAKKNNEAFILIDGFDSKYKKFNSKHLLIWQLITICKSQGINKLNMGGVSNVIIDNNKYTGLNEFKLGFNSKIIEYAGDFELITNKRNYNLYRNYVPLKNLIKSKLIK